MSVRILCGDALAMLRTLESESVQCVVTSPPYFQLRDYGCDGQIGLESTPAAFIDALVAVFDEVRRVLRSDGVCFVNLGDSYAGSGKGPQGNSLKESYWTKPETRKLEGAKTFDSIKAKDLMLIPERFAIAMQDRGWWVRSEIVWAKTSAMPESVRDRPTSAWEPIWMFTKSRTYFWDADAVRQPNTDLTIQRHANTPAKRYASHRPVETIPPGHPTASNPSQHHSGSINVNGGGVNGANLRNYWLLGPEPSRLEHYAGFPTEIPRRCIKAASRPGDTVLDPFLGTGTTALVADQLGRHAIGIELNPTYAEMARQRIENDAPMVSDPVTVDQPTQPALFGDAAAAVGR